MTRILRQSTQIDVRIGPFVDVADGFTPETGITLGAADEAEALRAGTATLDISGATWAAVTGADGWYTLTLSTTATSTVGELVIVVQDDSVCLPVYQTFYVVEEAVFDAFFAASATMPVTLATGAVTAAVIATGAIDADAIADNAIDAGAIASGAITAAKFGSGAIDAAALAADAGTEIATAVWASGTRSLTVLDEDSTTIDLNATIAAAVPTAAAIADAVWDEDATGHQTGGTFGQAIGDPGANTETIYDAVVTDAAGTNVAADIIAVKAETASILTDTAEIGAAGAGLTAADDAVIAAIAALNNLSAAQVNSEVVDALNTDTYAEPGQGSPGATVSLAAKIGYLYKAWRNRHTQTSSEYALYADDATTKDQEAVVSDNGTTFERGEISTGA